MTTFNRFIGCVIYVVALINCVFATAQDSEEQDVVVVYGALNACTNRSGIDARYYGDISAVVYGAAETGRVVVSSHKVSDVEGLLHKPVIMILERVKLLPSNFFRGYGPDPRKFILFDTLDNRKNVDQMCRAKVFDTPLGGQIMKQNAINIAKEIIAEREGVNTNTGIKASASRYAFGWQIWVQDRDGNGQETRGTIHMHVSDDGKMDDYQKIGL